MQNDHNNETSHLIVADKGKRFVNHLIDTLGFYFIIFLHAMILDGLLGVIPEEGSDWFGLYFFFLYIMYHALFEFFTGKTPGKMVTKTRVVKRGGDKPGFWLALGRNTARLIPFDALSFIFGTRGWHDQISGTYVVEDRQA